jgi:hypothetical protein
MDIDRGALEATNLFFVRALSRTVLVIVFSSDWFLSPSDVRILVIQLQKRPHRLSLSRLSKIAVMVKSLVYLIIRDSQAHKFS